MQGCRPLFKLAKMRGFRGAVLAAMVCPTVLADPPAIDFVVVAHTEIDDQPDGPAYDYRISRFELRNDHFVDFLNDALANTDDELGAFMFFDPANGNVHIGGSTDGPLMFEPSAGGHITFNDGTYETDPEFAAHPVVGVSWFGAVKFCNWLTLSKGLALDARVYTEGETAGLWHPVTITDEDWAERDLNDDERLELVTEVAGYRLPMDGGEAGASAYNEWFKAAAWDGAAQVNHDYGFGRDFDDGITGADANFDESNDPFEPTEPGENGTAPVGFYDGSLYNPGGDGPIGNGEEFQTTADENAFGLFDASGNVWEWIQDQSPSDPLKRRSRGGSWKDGTALLATNVAAAGDSGSTSANRGFRVVQSITGDFVVTPPDDFVVSGPWGGPFDPDGSAEYVIENTSGVEMSFELSTDAEWCLVLLDDVPVINVDIAPGDSVTIEVRIDSTCDPASGLIVGSNVATVAIHPIAPVDGPTVERMVLYEMDEPLLLTPDTPFVAQSLFASDSATPGSMTYSLENLSATSVEWSIEIDPPDATWLDAPSSGIWPPFVTGPVMLEIDTAASSALPVGAHEATATLTDNCTGETFHRSVSLEIAEPFTVSGEQNEPLTFVGLHGGPFEPSELVIEVTSETDVVIAFSLGLDFGTEPPEFDWLALLVDGEPFIDGPIVLDAFEAVEIAAMITETGESLDIDTYEATLLFLDGTPEETTGFEVERTITLDVLDYVVPETDGDFSGPFGGPFDPGSVLYSIDNVMLDDELIVLIEVEFDDAAADWLDVPFESELQFIKPGTIIDVPITLTGAVDTLEPGLYSATITFERLNADVSPSERIIRLEIGGEAFALPMVLSAGEDLQQDGPTHTFRMGRFEVTNRQYIRFLNNARANNAPGDPLGQYLAFDSETGLVTLSGDGTMIFDPSKGAAAELVDDTYVVVKGFDEHPVVGVSWYGAAKFCNWMTLIQKMPESARVYTEGPAAEDWAPVSLDPAVIATEVSGFRLPMDNGAATADPFNEWYKTASRMADDDDGPVFGAIYGFGRDEITGVDANFLGSGDPFEETGPTPVGFFDGVNLLEDETLTSDTENGYGVYDLTGNVAEWVHERDNDGATTQGFSRGGHFGLSTDLEELENATRDPLPADGAFAFVGFRVAQSIEPVGLSVIQDVDQIRATGPVMGPYVFDAVGSPSFVTATLVLVNDGEYTLDDIDISINADWLAVDGVTPQLVPPSNGADCAACPDCPGCVQLPLVLTDEADELMVSPTPPGSLVFVAGDRSQPDGPTHDFWVSDSEVTNDQFVTFLNDALANPSNARGQFMYHDTDSGDVYIGDMETGSQGTDAPSATITMLMLDSSIGRIEFDGAQYVVEPGFGAHPVVGVTWYGAVKYCNWRTAFPSEGLGESVRAYTESSDPSGWHPVTISDSEWTVRDLTDTERRDLIRITVGYRLPMDDGSGNVDPATDSADAYNEWLKATARKGVDADGFAVFGALYGFGRDTLTTVDGNYLDSGDPFETGGDPNVDGTSPRRFYDGTNLLDDEDDESETVDTENGYALYDTTGNVREWMQDWYADGDPSARAVRGGSWADPVDAVASTNFSRVAALPHVADDQTGFRVVRGTGHVAEIAVTDNINGDTHRRAVILDLREPLTLEPLVGLESAGTYCQGLGDVATLTYTLHNESGAEMPWEVVLEPDVEWLELPEVADGTITGGDDAVNDVEIVVSTNLFPNLLPPGEYTTDLRVTNTLTDESHTRSFSLTIEQPIVVTNLSGGAEAALDMFWEADVDGLPSFGYVLSLCTDCQINCNLDYEVMAVDDWLSVGPEEELTGTLPDPPESVLFQASANETASTLAVGEYVGTVAFAFVDPNNDVTPDPIERTIKLTVKDPIVVSPTSPWNPSAGGGLEPPPAPQTFLLTNMHATKDIGVVISVDVDWIDVDLPNQTVPPGAEQSVILSINDNGQGLTHGEYEATVTFADLTTGEDQTRDVVLTITEDLTVTPGDDFIASGQAGGPIGPIFRPYKLTNNAGEGGEPIEWSVSVDPWHPWISVIADGVPLSPGETRSLPDGASVFAFVTIDVDQTVGLADGTFESQLVFTTIGVEESTGRTITLTLVTPQFTVDDQAVSVDAVQTDGPTHTFKMGTHHTTNQEFTVFLNDAFANPDNERGQYMFFDTKTGDVYVNDDVVGESGTDLGELSALMFAAEAGGHIVFDGAAYEVVSGFEQHPAAGISWYGALKYCNWLTLDQGMLPSERCYREDTDANLAGWHPAVVTTEEWANGDLDDAQRFDLVVNFRGYRLPMDDGSNNENPTVDTPDIYNEWYKAASARLGDEGEIVFGMLYGFGRDEITGGDANFFDSGDPFEPGPTPIGFYDGTLYNPGGGGTIGDGSEFQTVADENAFGLRDMTGNVYQWMQGRFADDFGFRALRGGSWENVPGDQFSHLLVERRALGQPGFSHQTIGLRVVQSLATPNGDVDADGDIDLFDTGAIIACQTGPDAGGVSLDCGVFDFDVDDDVDLRDVGTLMNSFTGSP